MAVIINSDGDILCAAINEKKPGDLYIDDNLHYYLSVVEKILVTTKNDFHMNNGGQWWWRDKVPKGIIIDEFYLT